MSPSRTLKTWGSSSRLVLRKKRPTRVQRGSFVILKSGHASSFRCAYWALSSAALCTIVRILNILKRCPPRPVRSCEKNGLPGESMRMAIAQRIRMGMTTGRLSRDTTMSITRFDAA
jgi:hypothetical protein